MINEGAAIAQQETCIQVGQEDDSLITFRAVIKHCYNQLDFSFVGVYNNGSPKGNFPRLIGSNIYRRINIFPYVNHKMKVKQQTELGAKILFDNHQLHCIWNNEMGLCSGGATAIDFILVCPINQSIFPSKSVLNEVTRRNDKVKLNEASISAWVVGRCSLWA